MKNVLALDASTGHWYMNWVVTPGPAGNDASAPPFGGGLIFDPSIDSKILIFSCYKIEYTRSEANGWIKANVTGPYGRALLTIELQERGSWDFGDVEWRNIMIEANTTDVEWCIKYVSARKLRTRLKLTSARGPSLVDAGSPFTFTYTTPTASVLGTSTVCYIAQLVFHQPELVSTAPNVTHDGQGNGTVRRSAWSESSRVRRSSR